MFQSVLDKW